MGGFANVRAIVDAEGGGFGKLASWRKQPTQATGAGFWFDLSMSPGNPVPNYYIGTPNIFVPLKRSTDGGLDHGGSVSPKKKMLRQFTALTPTAAATPLPIVLCDYLGHYPFIDESVTDEQFVGPSSLNRRSSAKVVSVSLKGLKAGPSNAFSAAAIPRVSPKNTSSTCARTLAQPTHSVLNASDKGSVCGLMCDMSTPWPI